LTFPTLEFECKLLETHSVVIGIDEVGRGSLAGPLAVGAFVLTRELLEMQPSTLKDSKLIPEPNRASLAGEVRSWGRSAVEFVDAEIIDQHGIIHALRTAGLACLEKLNLTNPAILLDGNQNWLGLTSVTIRTKADRDCASVSAASIVAKVERDQLMTKLHEQYPEYDFASNKGYSSAIHIQALREHGPSPIHRKTWLTNILTKGLF
jgi:ribonuclease HII